MADYGARDLDEQELVRRITRGDLVAFGLLYDRYAVNLFGCVRHIIPNESIAEEILQDVFVKIYSKIHLFDPDKGRLFTWMLNIVKNECLDRIRSKAFRNSLQTGPINSWGPEGQLNPYTALDILDVRKCVWKLPPDLRTLIELSFFYGFSQGEIALLLQMPLGTVKSKSGRAYRTLRTMMDSRP